MKTNTRVHPLVHPFNFRSLLPGMAILFLWHCTPSPQPATHYATDPAWKGEVISLLGDTLHPPEITQAIRHVDDSLLQEAFILYAQDSTDLDNIIWYGRRLAYLHRYKDAIDIFSHGIRYHPRSPELYRHRGHRYITIRRLEDAIADLSLAASLGRNRNRESEPDGKPNKLNLPLSNLHFNIYYHLGLAYYLQSDYSKAIETFLLAMKYSDNPDLFVATSDWLFLSYLRTGDQASAEKVLETIHPNMEIIENEGYLERLLIYKGVKEPEALTDPTINPLAYATQNYGLSAWYDLHQLSSEAASLRQLILASGFWPAFGYIAAEADSLRLRPL